MEKKKDDDVESTWYERRSTLVFEVFTWMLKVCSWWGLWVFCGLLGRVQTWRINI